MSDYDIRPKLKVWAGSPNECWTFGQILRPNSGFCRTLTHL